MPSAQMKTRDVSIDALRTLCQFGVIVLHTTMPVVFSCGNSPQLYWDLHLAVFAALRWPVLIFFILSGVLFNTKLPLSKTPAYYWHRAKKILPPFIAWSIVYCFISNSSNTDWVTNWPNVTAAISKIYYKPSYYHMWFLYDFTIIIIVSPFIVALKNTYKIFSSHLFLLLTGAVLFATQIVFDFGHAGRIPVYIYYFYFGTFLPSFKCNYKYLLLFIGIVGIIYNFIAASAIVALTHDCDLVTNPMRYSFIQQLPIVLAVYFIFRDITIKNISVCTAINSVAKCGFGVYLAHPLFIWLFRLNDLNLYLQFPPLVFSLFATVVCFTAALGLSMLIRTNKYTSWLAP